MERWRLRAGILTTLCLLLGAICTPIAQNEPTGMRYKRFVIRSAMLVDGLGTPARGPVDIVVEGDSVTEIVPVDAVSLGGYGSAFKRPTGDRVIEAAGMYVLPGFIEMHGHTPEGRVVPGTIQGRSYAYDLWLAHGVTTVRDVGSSPGLATLANDNKRSAANQLAAPRIIPYSGWRGFSVPEGGGVWTPEKVRAQLAKDKAAGAAGIKIFGPTYADVLMMLGEEAKALGMGVAIHVGVADATAAVAARAGVTSIEHWYGIPDSAIPGVQPLPPDYNFLDELARFRHAGQLWRKADAARLKEVMDLLIERRTVLVPTFVAYEPNRDIVRAQNLPWYPKYAMPVMLEYWKPNPGHHGSYHYEWTTDDEVNWRQNFRLWMDFVREFWKRGGHLTVGSDPGGSFGLYGFTYVREMELYREMGLDPIDIIQAATTSAAKALGLQRQALGVRVGGQADLVVVDGNPLRDLKVLYGVGVQKLGNGGKLEKGGGIHYTIRDGILYDARMLLRDVERIVTQVQPRTSK